MLIDDACSSIHCRYIIFTFSSTHISHQAHDVETASYEVASLLIQRYFKVVSLLGSNDPFAVHKSQISNQTSLHLNMTVYQPQNSEIVIERGSVSVSHTAVKL